MRSFKTWLMMGALLGLLAGEAKAFRPNGWVYHSGRYGYALSEGAWFYFDASSGMFAFNYAAGSWNVVASTCLTANWAYYQWPYTYSLDANSWLFLNESDAQWCYQVPGGPWSKFGVAGVPQGMTLIAAGSFSMGDSFDEADSNEVPAHAVSVSAYYVDRTEVPLALWDEVTAWGLSHGYTDLPSGLGKAPDHPAHTLSWYDTLKWCNARSEREGRAPCYTVGGAVYRTGEQSPDCNWAAAGYRLPTEAEWEKAARGGASGRRYSWSDEDTIQHARANYLADTNSYSFDTSPTDGYHPAYTNAPEPFTSPAGSFAANGYGLYDTTGNVWEWCWDFYEGTYYTASPDADPRGPTTGTERVLRGGSWAFDGNLARVSFRFSDAPGVGGDNIGFRAVLANFP